MTLSQSQVTGAHQDDRFSYVDHLNCGLLQLGPSNAPKTFQVVDEESFAIAPNDTRYGIVTEPHDYDLRPDNDPRVSYVRDRVYLVDAHGRPVTRDWALGRWQFRVVVDGPQGRDARDLTLDVGAFDYNPLIHGPPN